jgi:hypothetical protein
MTQIEANNQLTNNLKQILKTKNYVDSGKLYKSIKVTLKQKSNGYIVSINSMNYLKYLEDGELVSNFIKSDSTKKIILLVIATNLKKNI